MNALLLSALLLLPATGTVPMPPAAPQALAATMDLPLCAPPAIGDWWLDSDCLLVGAYTVTGNVYVADGLRLELDADASLDLDFASRHLWIGVGARVVIGTGARIH